MEEAATAATSRVFRTVCMISPGLWDHMGTTWHLPFNAGSLGQLVGVHRTGPCACTYQGGWQFGSPFGSVYRPRALGPAPPSATPKPVDGTLIALPLG